MSKINKALDINKLYSDQKQGKLLKKHLSFPLYAGIKLDGNYSVVIKQAHGLVIYLSSGGHEYTPNEPTRFDLPIVPNGVYFIERIATDGKLGDRVRCALTGSIGAKVARDHTYMVHDMITLTDYEAGLSNTVYMDRRDKCRDLFGDQWIADRRIHNHEELDQYLKDVVSYGYEGLMLKDPFWLWKDSKSRKVELAKYKSRPTVDLLCVGATEGTGKYEGMIGSLRLEDSKGRIVDVGSGMSDEDRRRDPQHFIMKVVEVFYEQIIETYIQPTFGTEYEGVLVREDKTVLDID